MVAGTTASSGDHSSITGDASCAEAALGEFAEKFGMAGMGKAGAVEHLLGDRIGDDGRGFASLDQRDAGFDRGDRSGGVGGIGRARFAVDVELRVDDGQRAAERRAPPRRRDRSTSIGTSSASASPAPRDGPAPPRSGRAARRDLHASRPRPSAPARDRCRTDRRGSAQSDDRAAPGPRHRSRGIKATPSR